MRKCYRGKQHSPSIATAFSCLLPYAAYTTSDDNSQRYKLHRSVVVTSNRIVQDWGTYLGDNTMSTTILDRLMHHCHLLEFNGRSYRLKEAAETLARKTKES